MTRFLFQLFIFASLVIGGYFTIRQTTYVPSEFYHAFSPGYMSGIRLKHERANKFPGPRVFFVGGSSSAYGIDSQTIEEEINVPVVNLGLHAGLGTPFILDQAKMLMHEGDVIFICIEYLMGAGDSRLIEQTCRIFPEVSQLHNFNTKEAIRTHIDETREGVTHWIDTNNSLDTSEFSFNSWDLENNPEKNGSLVFNKYGDVINHLERIDRYNRPSEETKTQYHYWEGIALLNKFKQDAEAIGVSLFYSYPPYARSNYERHKSSLKKIDRDLQNDLDIEILNTPKELVFEDHYFYDTHYHLAKEGRSIRTIKMLEAMNNSSHVKSALKKASQSYEQH